MSSAIQSKISRRKAENGDNLSDILIDICFATSYKIEELVKMPAPRLERLIERYKERFYK